MQTTTIRKNQVAALFAQATSAYRHDLDGYFEAKPINPQWLAVAYSKSLRARVYANGEDSYTLQIHSNLWYEFTI